MMKNYRMPASLVLALALCVGVAGCSEMTGQGDDSRYFRPALDDYGTRIFSPTWHAGESDTLAHVEQQIDWAIAETEEALLVLGNPEEWVTLGEDQSWYEYRDVTLPELNGRMCHLEGTDHTGGHIDISIHRSYELAYEAAELLRVHWMKRGWVVTDIVREPFPDGLPLVYFRADRYGGATLSLYTSDNSIFLQVTTACSPNSARG